MDISGVDVDYLSDEEILELCSDTVDCSDDEITVLNCGDVNSLSDDKVQELYDNVMYSEIKENIQLADQEILNDNYNIIDTNSEEIALINGQSVNFDELSDDVILALYENTIDSGESTLLADNTSILGRGQKCSGTQNSTYNFYMYCYDSVQSSKFSFTLDTAYATRMTTPALDGISGYGSCYFYCVAYAQGVITCKSSKYQVEASQTKSFTKHCK